MAAVASPMVCSAGNWAGGAGVERLGNVVARGAPERGRRLRQRDDGEERTCALVHRRFFCLHLLVQRTLNCAGLFPVMLEGYAHCQLCVRLHAPAIRKDPRRP